MNSADGTAKKSIGSPLDDFCRKIAGDGLAVYHKIGGQAAHLLPVDTDGRDSVFNHFVKRVVVVADNPELFPYGQLVGLASFDNLNHVGLLDDDV